MLLARMLKGMWEFYLAYSEAGFRHGGLMVFQLQLAKHNRAVPLTRDYIFRRFVCDEERHAMVAERLARHYDVHRLRTYEMNRSLVRFSAHFADAIRHVSAETANLYITSGELILDVALLRSITEYVADDMSDQAMRLVNRDEARHIAIDFHMAAYHASAEYARKREAEAPRPLVQCLRAAWAIVNLVYHAAPFFRAVLFEPLTTIDPSGARLREAVSRIQLLAEKPVARTDPLARLLVGLYAAYNDHALVRQIFGRALERMIGAPSSVLTRVITEDDRRRVERMTFDELARHALAVTRG